MGGGAILDGKPLENIIGAKKMVPAVNEFIENIKNSRNSPEELYMNALMKMPAIITKLLAFMMTKSIKKVIKKKELIMKLRVRI